MKFVPFISRWFRPARQEGKRHKPSRLGLTFCPQVEGLEDRLTPSITVDLPNNFNLGANYGVWVAGNAKPTISTTNPNGDNDILMVLDSSGNFTQAEWAIQSATDSPSNNQGIVTITTPSDAPHTFKAGDQVFISGVGVSGYNGIFTVLSTDLTANTFQYNVSNGALAPSGGGAAANSTLIEPVAIAAAPNGATSSGDTVTITTTSPHGLAASATVNISGFTGSAAAFNGTFVINTVPTATTFTYTDSNISAIPIAGQAGASEDGASEVPMSQAATISTTTPLTGMQPNDMVTISGVALGGYNGTNLMVNSVSGNSFTYTASTSGLANSGGGTVTDITHPGTWTIVNSATTVTINTQNPHNLQTGDYVTISGVAPDAAYNGPVQITNVSPNSFQYTAATTGLTPSGGGQVQLAGGGGTVNGLGVPVIPLSSLPPDQNHQNVPSITLNSVTVGPTSGLGIVGARLTIFVSPLSQPPASIGTGGGNGTGLAPPSIAPFVPAASNVGPPSDVMEFAYIPNNGPTLNNSTFDVSAVNGFGMPLTLQAQTVTTGASSVGVSQSANMAFNRAAIGNAYTPFMMNDPQGAAYAELLYNSAVATPSGTIYVAPPLVSGQYYVLADPNDWLKNQSATTAANDPLATYWDSTLTRFFENGNNLSINLTNGTAGATESGDIVTITTSIPNTIQKGDMVTVSGVALAGYNPPGPVKVLSVSGNSFTFKNTQASNLAPSGGGQVEPASGPGWGILAAPNIYNGSCTNGTYTLSNGTNTYTISNPGTGLAGALWVFGQKVPANTPSDQGLLYDNIWEALCRGVALDGVFTAARNAGQSTTAWNANATGTTNGVQTFQWYTPHTPPAFGGFTSVYDTFAKFLHYSDLLGQDSRTSGNTPIFIGHSAYGFSEDENPNGPYDPATQGEVPAKMDGTVPDNNTVTLTIDPWWSSTTVRWIGPASGGDWDTAANWSGGSVPGATDDVFIGPNFAVTHGLNQTETINSLDIALGSNLNLAQGAITVSARININGGLLLGTGTINGNVNVNTSGFLLPGDFVASASPSQLTIAGNVTFASTSELFIIVNSATSFSQLVVSGNHTITLGSAVVGVSQNNTYVPLASNKLKIISASSSSISGSFNTQILHNVPNFAFSGFTYRPHDVLMNDPPPLQGSSAGPPPPTPPNAAILPVQPPQALPLDNRILVQALLAAAGSLPTSPALVRLGRVIPDAAVGFVLPETVSTSVTLTREELAKVFAALMNDQGWLPGGDADDPPAEPLVVPSPEDTDAAFMRD
jgi:hypothetical protein